MSTYQSDSPDTIILIHGLWMSPLSWEKWVERYGARGYRVLAPLGPA
jgi:pimeloyl-ACP methyl ester carboxylesterase